MLDLDSPKWAELEHAYGDAGDTPDLIRAIATEQPPNYDEGGAWYDVYSSLFHQHSTYSATYAAFPHIVRGTLSGTVQQRTALLIFAGQIRVYGNSDKEIPEELLPGFESAMKAVDSSAIDIVRDAWPDADVFTRGELLQAFGGLRFPNDGYVAQLEHMTREEWSVESQCPVCHKTMVCELHDGGVSAIQIGHGGRLANETTKHSLVARDSYSKAIQSGRAILDDLQQWNADSTAFVLAALAAELGDDNFAQKVLDLGGTITCAYCEASFVLSETLTPL